MHLCVFLRFEKLLWISDVCKQANSPLESSLWFISEVVPHYAQETYPCMNYRKHVCCVARHLCKCRRLSGHPFNGPWHSLPWDSWQFNCHQNDFLHPDYLQTHKEQTRIGHNAAVCKWTSYFTRGLETDWKRRYRTMTDAPALGKRAAAGGGLGWKRR